MRDALTAAERGALLLWEHEASLLAIVGQNKQTEKGRVPMKAPSSACPRDCSFPLSPSFPLFSPRPERRERAVVLRSLSERSSARVLQRGSFSCGSPPLLTRAPGGGTRAIGRLAYLRTAPFTLVRGFLLHREYRIWNSHPHLV